MEDSRKGKYIGRKRGVKNWYDKELDVMLDGVETNLPCGQKQWELVALHLFKEGFNREWSACKKEILLFVVNIQTNWLF